MPTTVTDHKPRFPKFKELIALPKFNLAFLQQLVAEFLASFIYMFIICGNQLNNNYGGSPGLSNQVATANVASFLSAMGLTYAFGQLSGAHFNPALTAGLMLSLKMNWIVGAIYILIQFLASFAAVGILIALFPDPPAGAPSIARQLVITPSSGINQAGQMLYQFVMYLFFVFLYLFFIYDSRPNKVTEGMSKREKNEVEEETLRYRTRLNLTPLFIGFAYATSLIFLTPWRVLAPCMIVHDCTAAWAYNVGDFLGAFGAAVIYLFFGLGQPAVLPATNPQVPPEIDE